MSKKKSLLGAVGLAIIIGVILQWSYGPSILRVPGVVLVIILVSIALISIPWKGVLKLIRASWLSLRRRRHSRVAKTRDHNQPPPRMVASSLVRRKPKKASTRSPLE
jgi:ABC-type dipeptide/oligopeptide/nickel transport system permease subunit